VAIPIEAPDGEVALGLGAKVISTEYLNSQGRLTTCVEDGSDDPEEKGHQTQSDDQRPSSTESLDTEQYEDGCSDDLGSQNTV
jgi:hypothetical protein